MESRTRETPRKQMEALKGYIGKEIEVSCAWYGVPKTYTGTLSAIEGVMHIEITDLGVTTNIPFVGYGRAIMEIRCDGKSIYNNPHVDEHYNCRTESAQDQIVLKSFGLDVLRKIQRYEDPV